MAKKMKKQQHKQHSNQQQKVTDESATSLSDLVSDDVLAKLKNAKQHLTVAEEKKKEQEKEQRIQERKDREKNKTFEELLEEYGDSGAKY
ncbi:YqkE family protein [Sporosarcina sp. GW1-11]|uniref:YqkE family protein n=1 Tax=Sporosarcina sp. GW1-11 TaxID=2899126 RepID=UPI00294E5A12|nr:YqkE family protein [Sporosarcina sp. GW1-11]MDV6377595.1 YqkE family protein [Sporosarcina sp. GW1-11]